MKRRSFLVKVAGACGLAVVGPIVAKAAEDTERAYVRKLLARHAALIERYKKAMARQDAWMRSPAGQAMLRALQQGGERSWDSHLKRRTERCLLEAKRKSGS